MISNKLRLNWVTPDPTSDFESISIPEISTTTSRCRVRANCNAPYTVEIGPLQVLLHVTLKLSFLGGIHPPSMTALPYSLY